MQTATGLIGSRTRAANVAYRVLHKEGRLYLSTDGSSKETHLIATDALRFVMDAGREVVSIEFVRDYSGRIGGLLMRGAANYAIEAQKVIEVIGVEPRAASSAP